MAQFSRTFRIFVSSTFPATSLGTGSDLKAECNALQEWVFRISMDSLRIQGLMQNIGIGVEGPFHLKSQRTQVTPGSSFTNDRDGVFLRYEQVPPPAGCPVGKQTRISSPNRDI